MTGVPRRLAAPGAALSAFLLARSTARTADHAAVRAVPGWVRPNYRGRPVSLAGGFGAALGATLAALGTSPRGIRPAVLACAGAAVAAGAYDDLIADRVEHEGDKGWRGHLRALRAGRPSGGVVKAAAVGGASLLAGRSLGGSWRAAAGRALLISMTANLVNLFDLRPGRAAKVSLLAGIVGSGGSGGPAGGVAGAVAGAAAACLPEDLGERRLLGDLGANTLGVLLGVRLATAARPTRLVTGAAMLALTMLSERVSFSGVIDRVAPLRALDRLGRRTDPVPGSRTAARASE